MTKSVSQMALQLLAEGYEKFIGAGVNIEINCDLRLTTDELQIGGQSQPQKRHFMNDQWVFFRRIKLDKDTPLLKEISLDTAVNSITGLPGTTERLRSLQAHYSALAEVSPFTANIASLLVATFRESPRRVLSAGARMRSQHISQTELSDTITD
jgi:hypothetical protein